MNKLPQKLFEMSQHGVSEDDIQFIFDALIHAEENGKRFVNVYQNGETTFLFTNDQSKPINSFVCGSNAPPDLLLDS
jgi:hypothetical protein